MKRCFLILAAIALLSLGGLLFYTEVLAPAKPRVTTPVADLAPNALSGWEVKDIPMAESDGMMQIINETLKFDGVLFRSYSKNDVRITVYAAYWTPGKTTPFDAGTHNPDSCWVGSGWNRLERSNANPGFVGDRELRPYEYGVYEKNRHVLPVIFWHLVNGEPNRYEGQNLGWTGGFAGKFERLPLVLKDIREYGLNQKQEQMFIRITLEGKPVAAALADPDVIRLFNAIDGLGIFKDKTWK